MKTLPKHSAALFASTFLLLNIIGCSKKNTPAPVNTDDTKVIVVYNASNRAANYPTTGIVTDNSGNLYVADFAGSIIIKVSLAGVKTTLAGSGSIGSADGIGTSASFNLPTALAIDASENIYVADGANNRIRKITPGGVVTTIAGNGTAGSANGIGTAASFNFPQGIAVDNAGNIYVADTGNDLIRKITPDGMVSTLAGKVAKGSANGVGSQATFNIPQGLAIDSKGNLYVADAGNNLIREITPGGLVSVAKTVDNNGIQVTFDLPNALAFDQVDFLYITNAISGQIMKVDPKGLVSLVHATQAGIFKEGQHWRDSGIFFGGTSF
ncbi:MAG: NHL domain-containing protein, partial [Mucilaginibacter sp.]